jgi:hypothetical protein
LALRRVQESVLLLALLELQLEEWSALQLGETVPLWDYPREPQKAEQWGRRSALMMVALLVGKRAEMRESPSEHTKGLPSADS